MSFFGNVDFFVKVALGQVPGVTRDIIAGRNVDVDTGTTPEDIWDAGGLHVSPTAARVHDIKSTSTSDTAVGSGAQQVTVIGLNAAFGEVTEVVTMNGITDVPTVTLFTRINQFVVTQVGSDATKANLGTITAIAQDDGTLTTQITPGFSVAQSTIFCIPAAKTALVMAVVAAINKSGAQGAQANAEMTFMTRGPVDVASSSNQKGIVLQPTVNGTSFIAEELRVTPSVLTEKTDIRIRVETVSDSGTSVTGAYALLLFDNSVL